MRGWCGQTLVETDEVPSGPLQPRRVRPCVGLGLVLDQERTLDGNPRRGLHCCPTDRHHGVVVSAAPTEIEISGGVSGDSRMKWLRMNSASISLPLGSSSAPAPAVRTRLNCLPECVGLRSHAEAVSNRRSQPQRRRSAAPRFAPLFLKTLPLMYSVTEPPSVPLSPPSALSASRVL